MFYINLARKRCLTFLWRLKFHNRFHPDNRKSMFSSLYLQPDSFQRGYFNLKARRLLGLSIPGNINAPPFFGAPKNIVLLSRGADEFPRERPCRRDRPFSPSTPTKVRAILVSVHAQLQCGSMPIYVYLYKPSNILSPYSVSLCVYDST